MQNQERVKVLEMLAAGKLSVEQADQLLKILDAKAEAGGEEQIARASTYVQEQPGRIGLIKASLRGSRGTRETDLLGLSIKEAKALKNHMVGADYIHDLEEVGLRDLSVQQIIALKNHLVDAKYVASLQEAGLNSLSVEQLIALKNHMVNAKYIATLMGLGLTELSVEQIIALKNYAVSPRYIASLREAGLTELSVEQIIDLSIYQVDPYMIDPQQLQPGKRFSSRLSRKDPLKG